MNSFKTKILSLILLAFLISPLPVTAACNLHNISGFIWSSNIGWISLSCKNNIDSNIDYGVDIAFDAGDSVSMIGYGWSPNIGWINFQPTAPFPAQPNNSALFTRATGESASSTAGTITGWAKIESLGDNGWIKLGPLNINNIDYGVQIGGNRAFSGYSWNGGEDTDADGTPEKGIGWIKWGDSTGASYGANVVARWFETLYGDVYSGKNIDQIFSPPASRYSATYLIQANGTINSATITSKAGSGAPYVAQNFESLTLPTSANSYRGSLGNLDRSGMIVGQYGTVITYSGDSNVSGTFGNNLVLDGKIYYFTGNLTVDSDITFKKGFGTQKGNGTILVDGDLIINANADYQSGAITGRIENLPVVAWIVKGNIIINPSVTSLVGVFFSEGANGINTGTTGLDDTDQVLVVKGMMIGKKITFQRLYVAADNTPSEQIIFDGRAIINPPPGLTDIIKGLPTITEVIP